MIDLCEMIETLFLVGSPEISPFGFPETPLGAEVRVVCIPSAKSALAWFKDGHELRHGDDGVNIQEYQGMLVLTIGRVTSKNAGNYTCTGTNEHGIGSFSAFLAVPHPPQWEIVPEDRVIISQSLKSRTLTCEASGSPKPEITWMKQGGIS